VGILLLLFHRVADLTTADRTELASKANADRNDMHAKLDRLTNDYEELKRDNFELTQEMTRHYKGMQDELLSRIRALEGAISHLRSQLDSAQAHEEEIIREKDLIINDKDREIEELKLKMEDMADEFSKMLKVSYGFLMFSIISPLSLRIRLTKCVKGSR
jgi:DNA repair exonuclease SbcCD ATPase subunit